MPNKELCKFAEQHPVFAKLFRECTESSHEHIGLPSEDFSQSLDITGFREALWVAETAADKTPGIKKVTKPLKELYLAWDASWQVGQNIRQQITTLTRKLERVGQRAEKARTL
eukprot:6120860-Amphidinium_carterae.1